MTTAQFASKRKWRPRHFLGSQYLILLTFWTIFIALLIIAIVFFLGEKQRINRENNVAGILEQISKLDKGEQKNKLYQQLLQISYPLIDFSLMSFNFIKNNNTTISDPSVAWTQRVNSINTAYSYIFITILIAIIAWIYYLVLIAKLYRRRHWEKKYNLGTEFPNDFLLYDTKMYLGFILNLAIVFSFFNFLTTLIALVYGLILVITSTFSWYVLKMRSEILVKHKWWKAPNFVLFTSVLLFQNSYSLLKAIFAAKFSVNLDLILTIIFPIGTITVILTLLIRNMLNSQITSVKTEIKNIHKKISAFQIFYYTQQQKSLEDYSFVSQLPKFIRLPLQKNSINSSEAFAKMTTINETIIFLQKKLSRPKELNYMLYHLFNNVTSINEINEIKSNINKTNANKANKKTT